MDASRAPSSALRRRGELPIYEYYCPRCNARFRQLVKAMDAPLPSCPGCGNRAVEKLVSRAHIGHSVAQRRADQEAQVVKSGSAQEAARLLQKEGYAEAGTPFGMDRDALREIIDRRAAGATDAELEDVSATLTLPEPPADSSALDADKHTQCDRGAAHDHGHCHEHHSHAASGRSADKRKARDLGWIAEP